MCGGAHDSDAFLLGFSQGILGERHMNKAAALFVIALLAVTLPIEPAVLGQSFQSAAIVVQVSDQYGVAYNGVGVTIYSISGSNTSQGVTVNGVFVSGPLAIDSSYVVLVNSGTSVENQTVNLNVTDTLVKFTLIRPPPLRPRLVITSVDYTPSPVTPSAVFDAHIYLNNTGTGTAYASALTVTPGIGVSLVGTTGTASVGTLDQNQSTEVTFQMAAASTLPSGYIPVSVSFSYTDILGNSYNDTTSFNIQIVSSPELRVGTFALSVAPLRPGTASVLTITLINVGGDRAYSVSMSLTGPVFLSTKATNYVGSVAAAGTASASFFLNVAENASVGTYPLTLSVNYTDVLGNHYFKQTTYSINVEPFVPPQVSVTNVLLDPPILTTGSQGTVTIFLTNSGSTPANNVSVSINGGQGIVTSNYFGVGTVAPGATVTQVVGLNVNPALETQSRIMTITVSYVDTNGNAYNSSVQYQTEVFKSFNLFSLDNLVIVLAIVVVVVLLMAVAARYRLLDPLKSVFSSPH